MWSVNCEMTVGLALSFLTVWPGEINPLATASAIIRRCKISAIMAVRRDLFPNELSAQTSGAIVEPLDRSGYSVIY